MKSLRKILAVLVATAMVAGMGAMAFAGSITIKSNDNVSVTGRTFKAYRILDASYSGTGSGSTIAYYVPTSLNDFYNTYTGFQSGSDNVEAQATAAGKTFDLVVTEKIADLKQDAEGLQKLIQAIETYFGQAGSGSAAESATYAGQGVGSGSPATAVIDGLDPGYYLVIDQSTATSGAEKKSALILDTVADQNPEITIKVNYSTPDKSIVGASGSGAQSVKDASGTFKNLEEVNNATVGSTVNFVVNQNVPNYYGYDHFYFILNDKMTDGLTFLPETVKVYVDVDGDGTFEDELRPAYVYNRKEGYTLSGTAEVTTPITHDTEKLVQGTDYYLYTETADVAHNGNSGTVDSTKTFEIAFKDIMRYPIGNAVRIEYAARVNSSALIGSGSNKNEVYLTFSNDPKNSHDGDSGSPKPGVPQNTTDHPTGDGPKDWTDTYTTGVKLLKVDNTGAILNDVQFTLTGESSEVVVNGQDVFIEDPNGQYYLLTNGKYTTKAPTTASYMDPAPSGAVSGYVLAETPTSGTDTSKWVSISGTAYRPYVVGESGPVYILHLANDADYESTVVKYSPASGTPTYQGKLPVRVTMVEETKGSGTLEFAQIGEGKYTISETKVPEGFNRAQDITFEIRYIGPTSGTSETSAFGDWEIVNAKQGNNPYDIRYNSGTGLFEVTVQNNKGVELPSTGGIGTTIFYAGGAILVLLAGILLVSKRRFA